MMSQILIELGIIVALVGTIMISQFSLNCEE